MVTSLRKKKIRCTSAVKCVPYQVPCFCKAGKILPGTSFLQSLHNLIAYPFLQMLLQNVTCFCKACATLPVTSYKACAISPASAKLAQPSPSRPELPRAPAAGTGAVRCSSPAQRRTTRDARRTTAMRRITKNAIHDRNPTHYVRTMVSLRGRAPPATLHLHSLTQESEASIAVAPGSVEEPEFRSSPEKQIKQSELLCLHS